MAHWNYRIMLHRREEGDEYGIHEVYYNDDGSVYLYTENALLMGDNVEDLKQRLEMMLKDVERSKDDILEYGACTAFELNDNADEI